MQDLKLFVTGHKGFETPLLHELRDLLGDGVTIDKQYGGIAVEAGIDAVYRICLHARLVNRVFCELGRQRVEDEAQLYAAVYAIPWESHCDARDSIAVSATVSRSKLDHEQFIVQRSKDAIVDRFRERSGSRPVVERERPDIRIHVHLHRDRAVISLDLSGESLHRRGYRLQHAGAPLKEHLAAALLRHAGWNRERSLETRLVDPLCGSGTFVVEAALVAANMAPGLGREYFGFLGWKRHQAELWRECVATARAEIDTGAAVSIVAGERDARALEIARGNARRAGVEHLIDFRHQAVAELELDVHPGQTLICCNPPWGRRLKADGDLGRLYAELGQLARRTAPSRLAVLSANPDLLHRLELKRLGRKDVRNGAQQCLFAEFAAGEVETMQPPEGAGAGRHGEETLDLRNRLGKNARHLKRWAERNGVSCYRLYDADLPEFAFALDRYQSEAAPDQAWFHLQEYQAPSSIEPELAERRLRLACEAVREVFAIDATQLFVKTRSRQRGSSQYGKFDERGEFFRVREGQASLLINLSDYLDSGLFLDHRAIRERIFREAGGKSVLNLFCYTGSVGVHAALGGAREVINVDLSATYLDWARENYRVNGLDDASRHRFLRADILDLLRNPGKYGLPPGHDLIFFDPPSFSNSSKMQQTLDIQRDHAELIDQTVRLLAPGGLLLFSTNRRGFRLDPTLAGNYAVNDISRATLPEDFRRRPGIHQCWEIRRPA